MTKDHVPPLPPDCVTEAEKKAFAFGWFKAMEAQRLAQPKQEPVAWLWELTGEVTTDPDRADGMWLPLYTTPPQRTWVGLTEEDKQIAFDSTQEGGGFWEFADAIEAKLKEKNT